MGYPWAIGGGVLGEGEGLEGANHKKKKKKIEEKSQKRGKNQEKNF